MTPVPTEKTAAVALVERLDERLLVVWNPRYGGWAMPGGRVEEGEHVVVALTRELREETGCELVSALPLFEGPHGIDIGDPTRAKNVSLFRVTMLGTPCEMETGCPITWLTRAEFLKWSPFRSFYEQVFLGIPVEPSPETPLPPEPLPIHLWCPECGTRHIDVGEFATKVHHTHACQGCGHVWRPAIFPTVGVQFLPGFKNLV